MRYSYSLNSFTLNLSHLYEVFIRDAVFIPPFCLCIPNLQIPKFVNQSKVYIIYSHTHTCDKKELSVVM